MISSIERQPTRASGFSLVEVMISLAIISLVVGIVLPNGLRMVERFEERRQIDTIEVLIEAQRAEAISQDRVIELDEEGLVGLVNLADPRIPAQFVLSDPLIFSPAGVCKEATIELLLGETLSQTMVLTANRCQLEVVRVGVGAAT